MNEEIVGQKIVEVRDLTEEEMDREGWDGFNGLALVLENGVVLYPSRDGEGNGPGALFFTMESKSYRLATHRVHA